MVRHECRFDRNEFRMGKGPGTVRYGFRGFGDHHPIEDDDRPHRDVSGGTRVVGKGSSSCHPLGVAAGGRRDRCVGSIHPSNQARKRRQRQTGRKS